MMQKKLKQLRNQIDDIDHQLIQLLAARFQTVDQIWQVKQQLDLPAKDMNRWNQASRKRQEIAGANNVEYDLVKDIFELIHQHALEIEK